MSLLAADISHLIPKSAVPITDIGYTFPTGVAISLFTSIRDTIYIVSGFESLHFVM